MPGVDSEEKVNAPSLPDAGPEVGAGDGDELELVWKRSEFLCDVPRRAFLGLAVGVVVAALSEVILTSDCGFAPAELL